MGDRGPKPKKPGERFTKRNISFPPGLEKRIAALAERDGTSFSSYVAAILERAARRRERSG